MFAKTIIRMAITSAMMPVLTYAMNPEDVKGVLSDAIVPTPDLCEALCKANKACFYSIYSPECDECWQMDCSLGDRSWGSKIEYTKLTTEKIYTCNHTDTPPGLLETGCKKLTATATITSVGDATETDSGDKKSSAWRVNSQWVPFGAAVAAALMFSV